MTSEAGPRTSIVLVAATIVAIVGALGACSSDANAPNASVRADTTVFNDADIAIIERYNSGADTNYYVESAIYDGAYVEMSNNSGNVSEYRMLMQTELPVLKNNVTVDSARVYQYVCSMNGVQTVPVVVDHLNWGAAFLDSASFVGQSLQTNVGSISTDETLGWKSVSVGTSVQADYDAGRSHSQFRERYDVSPIPSGNSYVEFAPQYCGAGAGGQGYMVIWSH